MRQNASRRVSVGWVVVVATCLGACAGRSPVAPSEQAAPAAQASSASVEGLRATASTCPSFTLDAASVVGGVLTLFVNGFNCVPATGANVLVRVPFTTTSYTFPLTRQSGTFFPGYVATSVGFAFTRGECRLLTVINPDGQRSNDLTYCRPAN